ncbi:MAG: peptidoglycan DD-metalloendopeptidase family protein [Gemmatimonadaceae bacterium]|nr:peptidoglycan DD-metalloendopeptidase family protein [Gemmatimonadaceae bacterium]
MRSFFIATALLGSLASFAPHVALAQTAEAKLRQQQDELARIRKEREDLQRRMKGLQTTAHDLSEEVNLINRQHSVTERAVRSLDQQLSSIREQVDVTTGNLMNAEVETIEKRSVLQQRLVDIYKRGPLYTSEVLLSAQSFGNLVARYKYLHIIALRDRALMDRVRGLRDTIRNQRRQLVQLQNGVSQNRQEKAQEEARLRELEGRRALSLKKVQADTKKAKARLDQLARSEARLNSVLASIEAERRRVSGRGAASRAPSSIRTSDLGRLDWPVEGTILYRFGRVINPNNTTTRWNGMGIQASSGTPVKSVSNGTVALNDIMGTYGRTVIVDHGGGDYSVYSSLSQSLLSKASRVTKGQTIGTVGSNDPSLPPHLHFEIRRGGGPAVDPFEWLRGR